LEELTFGVELFLPLSVRRGQSVMFVVFVLVFVFDLVLF
jgi:hypothetical protein